MKKNGKLITNLLDKTLDCTHRTCWLKLGQVSINVRQIKLFPVILLQVRNLLCQGPFVSVSVAEHATAVGIQYLIQALMCCNQCIDTVFIDLVQPSTDQDTSRKAIKSKCR